MINLDKMYARRCLGSSRTHLLLLLLTILSIASFTAASTPTSFCKCTCFSNSTIIPLDPSKSSSGTGSSGLNNVYNLYERAFNASPDPEVDLEAEAEKQPQINSESDEPSAIAERTQKYRALSCNDCNRKFCLDYELPICKDAKEEDVFTTCFQRDSRKDEAVVFIFIFATGGLLTWALLKPWIERYIEAARERRSYMPVGEPDS